jgi:hypothetical protein
MPQFRNWHRLLEIYMEQRSLTVCTAEHIFHGRYATRDLIDIELVSFLSTNYSPNSHNYGNTNPQREFLGCPLASCLALVFEHTALHYTRPCLHIICQLEMLLPTFVTLQRLKVTDTRIDFLFTFRPLLSCISFRF